MKRLLIVPALLAAFLFVSCVENEEFGGGVDLPENGIAFVFNGAQTKSADFKEPKEVPTGLTIPIINEADGTSFYLSETITDLNDYGYGPMTKGSPIYKENVTTVDGYTSLKAVTYLKGGSAHTIGNASFDYDNAEGQYGLIYAHTYPESPWPKDDPEKDVYFFLQMPGSATGVSAPPSGTTAYDSSNGKMAFSYTSPATAAAQQDILFVSRTLNKKQYYANFVNTGAPVTFLHALTGVKFRNGGDNDHQTKTIITNVKFVGLYDSGVCTVYPDATGDTPKVSWQLGTLNTKSEFTVSDAGYTNPDYDTTLTDPSENSDGTVNFEKPAKDPAFGDSWYSAGNNENRPYNENNLNDEAGSLTFWFVPQAIPAGAKLIVTFCIKTPDTPDGAWGEHEIDLGTLLSGVTWKAGELRTYTLDPKEVDVTITDEITEYTKSNLHVTNTGNVDEYVRMLIMGNWYGWKPGQSHSEEPSILVGYQYESAAAATAAGHPEDPMVLPWYREGYPLDNNGVYYYTEDDAEAAIAAGHATSYVMVDPYGYFDSSFTLAKLGDRDGNRDDWADASGGFYYTMPIGPGQDIEEVAAMSKDLFQSYTVTDVPEIYVSTVGDQRGLAEGVHLVMEIVVQAIAVPETANGRVWWLEAWYEATKVQKLNPLDTKSNGSYRNRTYLLKYNAGAYSPTVYDKIVIPTSL